MILLLEITESANFQLRKYNWTSWWQNIAPAYVDLNGAIVTQFSASALVSKLPYWKYKFDFSISDDDWPSSKQVIFFIDDPELIIYKSSIDIWNIPLNTLKLSSDYQEVKVKTIWTPYNISMKNPEDLKFDVFQINPFTWIEWWWYKIWILPFKKIDNPEYLWNLSFRESISWNKFEDDYLFQFWAKNNNIMKAPWDYEWSVDFDINLKYCPEYESNWIDCKENDYAYIEENSWVKTWSDWTYARTCNHYRRWDNPNHYYTWDVWSWVYLIQPDLSQGAFEVYCDMSTNWWGRTQYVDIKWNYPFSDARDCWLWNIIDNSNLKCFNPNRFRVAVTELYNDDWSWTDYFYDISDVWVDISTPRSKGSYRCLWHSEFMTIMTRNPNTPNPDWSNAVRARLWKTFCPFLREVAWKSQTGYMNYDTLWSAWWDYFWENAWAKREGFARLNKLYFRNNTSENIEDYNSWRRWTDWTYARSCNEYKNPPIWYSYSWSTWDWEYYIDSDWIWWDAPYLVTCNMTIDSWGWTLLQEWVRGAWSTYIAWNFSWWNEILMTYKREFNPSSNYAIKVIQFKTRQCWNEHTTIADYVDHMLNWTWWYCSRITTPWDYNDIITEKVIEWIYVNDSCVNWNLHKTTDRNTSWSTDGSSRWIIEHRLSNTTVLWSPTWAQSFRCAWNNSDTTKRWIEADTWVR